MDSKRGRGRLDVGRFARRATLGVVSLLILAAAGDARAQIAGTANRPLPNVLLLVDTSGSMERMPDNSLPSANKGLSGPFNTPSMGTNPPNACTPGAFSTPNRWGMLLQALTGNMQPYFSCDAVDRTQSKFYNEFRIGSGAAAPSAAQLPYDKDYFLPYHRPITGDVANACALTPWKLPGVASGSGVGPGGGGINTAPYSDPASFPPDAYTSFLNSYLVTQYGTGANGAAPVLGATNECTFSQAADGQLDATKDFIRFGLMTFDNDPNAGLGVSNVTPAGNVLPANPFQGQWSYLSGATGAVGQLPGCGSTTPFEVGARHWSAPPWEGRMVRFPDPDGSLYDINRTNDEIQRVLLGTRPYGATPIDGMMNDARHYFWNTTGYGPLGSIAGYADPYVASACREQYIVLLTDGAPNLDLRPNCQGTGGICPFPDTGAMVANALSTAAGSQRVKTFVIGFAVTGEGNATYTNDGFPTGAYPAGFSPPDNNCKRFYSGVTAGGTNPNAMNTLCSGASKPPAGSTADACCKLSEIAYYGNPPGVRGTMNATPPFFAETQADLVLSFGRVLGGIAKNATTRTLPGYAPAVSISGASVTADFVASFIPNAQKVWSGEIDRTRSICTGCAFPPCPQASQSSAGDSFAFNLASQATANKRLFVSWKHAKNGAFIDSAETIRPFAVTPIYAPAFTGENFPAPVGLGVQLNYVGMAHATDADWPAALDIDGTTCKRSRANDSALNNTIIPALNNPAECTDVIWGFATAHSGALTYGTPATNFNVRCKGAGSARDGVCSVHTAQTCNIDTDVCPGLYPGEVCVAECSALGAIYRSSPTLVGSPSDLLRDADYRALAEQRKQRRPAMFVATTDGVLHAFKALSGGGPPAFDVRVDEQELWAFVPPAVLPRLASNYPTGQQILLDGTPVVKDVVWDRKRSNPPGTEPAYHTTLVAGMGAGGSGYYALNVTDVDCQGSAGIGGAVQGCLGNFTVQTGLANVAALATKGPHFLWQLTDVPCNTTGPVCTDTGKFRRKSKDGVSHVALFGRESGNAQITTLNVDPDGTGVRQIGVAILPGGFDGPPVKGEFCPRIMGTGPFTAVAYDASDSTTFVRRNAVRKWAPGACGAVPVPGRSVTIVRLDTGEILRHFGRKFVDVPTRLNNATEDSPFDSPIIGTPSVFPNDVGVPAQRIFVGDADGTLWRIDVSSPTIANWRVNLFQDVITPGISGVPAGGLAAANVSQPIQVPPVLTQDAFGSVVVVAATGDQENVTASADQNYVMSVREQRAVSTTQPGKPEVRWYLPIKDPDNVTVAAERVTGPMTVFDRTLYFATYRPAVPTTAGSCLNGGTARLWGMDFVNADGGTSPGTGTGGVARWCPIGSVDSVTGNCTAGSLAQYEPASAVAASLTNSIIPGVTIRANQPCASTGGAGNDYINSVSATKFDLFFGSASKSTTAGALGGAPAAARAAVARPLPRAAARIDSWALLVD